MTVLIDLAKDYFQLFSAKDLEGISGLLAKDVTLKDWEISAVGHAEVMAACRSIFDAVESISVIPTAVYADGATVVAEIDIIVNGEETLHVVDLLSFDADSKICRIRAYKG